MNVEQREIIACFYETILQNGKSGDFVNCYNDSVGFIKELCQTNEKLKQCVDIVNESFEE